MNPHALAPSVALIVLMLLPLGGAAAQSAVEQWKVHDMERPVPPVVDPGAPGRAPSDAVVLFDGTDLSAWRKNDGSPAAWAVRDGYLEVVRRAGSLFTRQPFGDVQLHLEWAAPAEVAGEGQGRGNSGIKFMGKYEVQVLDSHDNRTYADGMAGAAYGQYPPLVNASRRPGEWQTYDIVFRRPRFDPEGKLLRPAYLTVFLNGVLVQDHVELSGPTGARRPPYEAHEEKLPIMLQDHGNPVRYRNIWVRELE